VHEYVGPKVRLYHLDLYRLETERELLTLGAGGDGGRAGCAGAGGVGGEVFRVLWRGADGEIAIETCGVGMSGCLWCGFRLGLGYLLRPVVAVDGALFVAGGAVVFFAGAMAARSGGVVLGGHGYGAEEEASEGGVLVEDFAALGVDVEEVEGGWGSAGFRCEAGFDAAEKELEDGGFEGVEEEGEGGGSG